MREGITLFSRPSDCERRSAISSRLCAGNDLYGLVCAVQVPKNDGFAPSGICTVLSDASRRTRCLRSRFWIAFPRASWRQLAGVGIYMVSHWLVFPTLKWLAGPGKRRRECARKHCIALRSGEVYRSEWWANGAARMEHVFCRFGEGRYGTVMNRSALSMREGCILQGHVFRYLGAVSK